MTAGRALKARKRLIARRKLGMTPFARGRSGWSAMLLAVLLAFSWQSFLTQTHEHFQPESLAPVAAAPGGDAASQHDRKSPSNLPDDCWICRAVAHAGHALLPQETGFDASISSDFWLAAPPSASFALAARSHTWRSRAPPSSLQA